MKNKSNDAIDISATFATTGENNVLGDVLAEGARLIAAGKIPKDVLEERNGCYALCLVEKDGETVRELKPGDSVAVGRAEASAASEWHVADKWLSKAHFKVVVDTDGIPRAEDLESLNGTFINDRRVNGVQFLVRGDCIRAGHSVFLVL